MAELKAGTWPIIDTDMEAIDPHAEFLPWGPDVDKVANKNWRPWGLEDRSDNTNVRKDYKASDKFKTKNDEYMNKAPNEKLKETFDKFALDSQSWDRAEFGIPDDGYEADEMYQEYVFDEDGLRNLADHFGVSVDEIKKIALSSDSFDPATRAAAGVGDDYAEYSFDAKDLEQAFGGAADDSDFIESRSRRRRRAIQEADFAGQSSRDVVNTEETAVLPDYLRYDSAEDTEFSSGLDSFQHTHSTPSPQMDTEAIEERGVTKQDRLLRERFAAEQIRLTEARGAKADLINQYLAKASNPDYDDFISWAQQQGEGEVPNKYYFNNLLKKRGGTGSGGYEVDVEAAREEFNPDDAPEELKQLMNLYAQATDEDAQVEPSVDQKFKGIYAVGYRTAKGRALKRHAFICGSPGIGKEQPHSARILTPTGWTTMGEIAVGDIVRTPNNKEATVLQKFPQGEKPVYRITLHDGRTAEAGLEHLWKVIVREDDARNSDYQILQTQDLIEALSEGKSIYVPYTDPIEFEQQDLPLDPYALGLLLGDGGMSSGGVTFTSVDMELVDALETLLQQTDDSIRIVRSEKDHRIVSDRKTGRETQINKILRSLGLKYSISHTKFIPQIYKESTIRDRIAIVQGLMDTDGYVTRTGQTQYTTVSPQLAKDFAEIIYSLGGRCSTIRKENGYSGFFSLTFSLPINLGSPVRLSRKLKRYTDNTRQERRHLSIKSIEFDRVEESSCIMLDSEDHLYLTDNYVITHNTFTVAKAAERGAEESKQLFAKFRGSIGKSLSAILAFLWMHRENYVVLLDDADGFLTGSTDDVMNTLKAAMDTDEPMVSTGSPHIRKNVAKMVGMSESERWSGALNFDTSRLHEGIVTAVDREGNVLAEEVLSDSEQRFWEEFTNANQPKPETKAFLESSFLGRVQEGFFDDEKDEGNETGLEDEIEDEGEGKMLPATFYFGSRIIFISNMMQSDIPDAISGRCNVKELYLTRPEIMVRLEQILPELLKNESAYEPAELAWAKANVFRWMKAVVMAEDMGAPIALASGKRVPVSINVPITFRMFNDFVDGWMQLADEAALDASEANFDQLEEQIALQFVSQVILPALRGDMRSGKKQRK